jgi:hypothetical protein
MLQRTIRAVIRAGEQSGYTAECLEITRNLREAVELHLADEDMEALGLSSNPTIIVTMELRGSHAKLRRVLVDGTVQTLTVPVHGALDAGTGRAMLRHASGLVSGLELRSHVSAD